MRIGAVFLLLKIVVYYTNNNMPQVKSRLQERGTTLIEVIVVVFIIAAFSSILISDFPKILRQFALSRSAYRLAQDLRKVQDLGLSGVLITGDQENGQAELIKVKGYGIYFDLGENTQYIIYADRGDNPDFKYNGNLQICDKNIDPQYDCILELVDLTDDNKDLYIKEIINIDGNFTNTSINFTPPNPDVSIDHLASDKKELGLVLGLKSEPDLTRTVWVNKAGLIRVE